MGHDEGKSQIMRIVDSAYPDSLIQHQIPKATAEEHPADLLAKCIVSIVNDLYDRHSSSAANSERIAHTLEVSAATLESVASALRRNTLIRTN